MSAEGTHGPDVSLTTPALQTVALVGNPNTGKSTLFNALTGLRQRIGNYPGVTVEKKNGKFVTDQYQWDVIDLPGTYSLAPRSPDERVTLDVLLGQVSGVQPIDLIVCVVDASNLRRNLYLVSQILELGLPTVVALTMVDVAKKRGEEVSAVGLSQQLGIPVVPIHAAQKIGISPLKLAMDQTVGSTEIPVHHPLPTSVYQVAIEGARQQSGQSGTESSESQIEVGESADAVNDLQRSKILTAQQWIFLRYLLDSSPHQGKPHRFAPQPDLQLLESAREKLSAEGLNWQNLESENRYRWIDQQLANLDPPNHGETHTSLPGVSLGWSDRIDNLLTHRIWGGIAFVAMMLVLFTAVFKVADPFTGLLETSIDFLKELVIAYVPPGTFQSLLTSGVLDGVGGVLVFLPQIFVLFFFIGVLEDSGYLARTAFLMDRWMTPLGLSGKSFIPLLSSFACAVPGIMGTRVIDRPRDRLLTIMIAPLMSCSARLPVYIVFTQAFIPEQTIAGFLSLRAIIFVSMYLVGIVVAAAIAFLWKRIFWRETSGDFFLELPSYKWPSFSVVLHRMWERGSEFVKRAGTVILAMTILIWAANYFPRNDSLVQDQLQVETQLQQQLESLDEDSPEAQLVSQQLVVVENQIAAVRQENSYLGQAGKWIEPAVRPLGWDWKIGCAVLASFPAREVVVATLGVLYGVGEEQEDESGLYTAMRESTWHDTGEPVFNIPVALSVMVFFALCSQCLSTLATIYNETRSWVWPVVSFVYMTVIAYMGALLVYQVGMLFV